MRIEELYIKAFGRFSDKKVLLEDGLNIVYGRNEKGKSTIHRFIEAMLFGFAKPGVKRRVMMEEYDLYRPWTGDLYEGSLVYETGGRLYKIERNMARGREGVRVFDYISGQEITQDFNYDKARKELLFARQHLGLSQSIYRNTISICQLGNKSDAQLAREIQMRLGNLSTAGDADISVSKAEKLIKEYLDGIGTDRAYSKEYGRLCRQIEELEEGLGASAATVENLRSLGQQLTQAETKAQELRKSRGVLEGKIKDYDDSLLLGRWADIKRLKENQQSLTSQLDNNRGYKGLDVQDSQELFTLDRLVEQDRREVLQIQNKINETSLDIAGLTGQASDTNPQGSGQAHGPAYYRKRLGSSRLFCILSVLAAFGTVALAATRNPVLYGMLIPLLALFIYFYNQAAKCRGHLKEQERAAQKLGMEQQYMERYREDMYSALSNKKEELRKREERIRAILEKGLAQSVEEYRERLMGYERYNQLQGRLEETVRLLDIRLDGEDYDEMRIRAQEIEESMVTPLGQHSREQLEDWKQKLEQVKESQSDLLGNIEKTRGSIETLQLNLVDLPGMEEELSKARERLEQLEQERTAATAALEILGEASAEVHREFAPMLNRRVGEIIARITEGRYTDLRITGQLEILALAPETGRQVQAEQLSGGTVDQFYFACRMAASDLLSGDNHLPLFLDDSFVQYDIHRLERIMEYLIKASQTRQIIIFTCHNREKEVADRLGGVYNYLKIE